MDVEFEGTEDFIDKRLSELISNVLELYVGHKDSMPEPLVENASVDSAQMSHSHATNESHNFDLSTSTIASVTNASSGSDLLIAAAAHLTLTKGMNKMLRSELLGEMQTATSYYKQTFSNNLSTYLSGLVKADRLRLVAKDTYAISSTERKSMEATLAEG